MGENHGLSHPRKAGRPTPARWSFVLVFLGISLAGTSRTMAGATATKDQSASGDPTTGTADASGYNVPPSALVDKTRKEFERLGLQMVSMSNLLGETSVFIKYNGSKDQLICTVGQVIGGFKIISIQPDYTVFEGNGVRLWLALGQKSDQPAMKVEPVGAEPKPLIEISSQASKSGVDPVSDFNKDFVPVRHKGPDEGMKKKTVAYAAGKVVDGPPPPPPPLTAKGKPGKAPLSNVTFANSLPIGSFMMPINGTLSSGFGYRKQPTGGAQRYHKGVDIQAPMRSIVRAASDGVVKEVSRSWAKGLNVLIQHGESYETAYFHLDKCIVSQGDHVKAGEQIGNEGMTGVTTGPHLHFEIHKNGEAVDPSLYLRELAEK